MKHIYSWWYSIWIIAFTCVVDAKKADLVVFSYDRPMQLYAFLESAAMYLDQVGQVTVIYRATDERFEASYKVVQKDFPHAVYLRQSQEPSADFKPLTLKAVYESPHEHVLFAVDDIIVKDFVDLAHCIELMEQEQAYGFYLRLGAHLNYCYTQNRSETPPQRTMITHDVDAWTFGDGQWEWRYPHTVDMTVYNKKEIEPALRGLQYANPNTFEGCWAGLAGKVMHCKGLCFTTTKMVNLPLNRVQSVYQNRHMDAFSSQELLELFEQGKKIDIHDLYKIENKSPHMDYVPRFVIRHEKKRSGDTKHFVLVVASYNNAQWYEQNLRSIFAQEYESYHVIYIDDNSTDQTGAKVEAYIKTAGQEHRVTFIKNRVRYGALENQYRACYSCHDDDIVVIVDGDDILAHDQVLSYLNNVYQSADVWMTYGQFREMPSGALGFCAPMPDYVVEHNFFRKYPHIPSHLRTFYAGLFKQIKPLDLKRCDTFLTMTGDMAAMIPMIEMARQGHFRFIPDVLYLYNAQNPISDHRVSKHLQREIDLEIRSKKPYEAITHYIREIR